MKNKLTVTRGEGRADNGGKGGKGCQGTCIKDTWTKPKGWEVGMAGVRENRDNGI